jgi:transcription initiation factor TFIIIB Brf1 subunit/transcription initiation factor TFIIB
MKWWLRSCPRCGGDLYEDVYSKGEDFVCLQCGLTLGRAAIFGHPLGTVDASDRTHVERRLGRPGTLTKD